mgnify:CR=1 FL=1
MLFRSWIQLFIFARTTIWFWAPDGAVVFSAFGAVAGRAEIWAAGVSWLADCTGAAVEACAGAAGGIISMGTTLGALGTSTGAAGVGAGSGGATVSTGPASLRVGAKPEGAGPPGAPFYPPP